MAVVMDLGEEQITIENYDDLLTFIANERAKWSWVGNGGIGALQGHVQGQTAELNNQVVQHREQGQPLSMAVNLVQARFAAQLLYSGSRQGISVLNIRSALGDAAAEAAYGLARGMFGMQELRSLEHIRGMLAYAYPALMPADPIIRDLTTERAQLRRTITELNRRVEAAEQEREKALRMAQRLAARRFLRTLNKMKQRDAGIDILQRTKVNDFEGASKEAIERFAATEATYKEKMALLAPVSYWEAKAADHKRHERSLKWWVVAYFAIVIPAVIWAFGLTGGWLIGIANGGGKVDSALYVVAGAGLAAVTTLVLWAGRLLTRFYLSQNHLYHDAGDRAVMTKTYLALTAEERADEKDRAIILAALFRPSADGIVKDDGAPDLGVSGVASKILTGGKP